MGGRDDDVGLTLSLGFGVTTQSTHMQRPSSMHNHHLRKTHWNELFQFSGNLWIFWVVLFLLEFFIFCVGWIWDYLKWSCEDSSLILRLSLVSEGF